MQKNTKNPIAEILMHWKKMTPINGPTLTSAASVRAQIEKNIDKSVAVKENPSAKFFNTRFNELI
jgi:hypothetical protein